MVEFSRHGSPELATPEQQKKSVVEDYLKRRERELKEQHIQSEGDLLDWPRIDKFLSTTIGFLMNGYRVVVTDRANFSKIVNKSLPEDIELQAFYDTDSGLAVVGMDEIRRRHPVISEAEIVHELGHASGKNLNSTLVIDQKILVYPARVGLMTKVPRQEGAQLQWVVEWALLEEALQFRRMKKYIAQHPDSDLLWQDDDPRLQRLLQHYYQNDLVVLFEILAEKLFPTVPSEEQADKLDLFLQQIRLRKVPMAVFEQYLTNAFPYSPDVVEKIKGDTSYLEHGLFNNPEISQLLYSLTREE